MSFITIISITVTMTIVMASSVLANTDEAKIEAIKAANETVKILINQVNDRDKQMRFLKPLIRLRHEIDTWEDKYYKLVLDEGFENLTEDRSDWQALPRHIQWTVLIGVEVVKGDKKVHNALRGLIKEFRFNNLEPEEVGQAMEYLHSNISQKLFNYAKYGKNYETDSFSDPQLEICKNAIIKCVYPIYKKQVGTSP